MFLRNWLTNIIYGNIIAQHSITILYIIYTYNIYLIIMYNHKAVLYLTCMYVHMICICVYIFEHNSNVIRMLLLITGKF